MRLYILAVIGCFSIIYFCQDINDRDNCNELYKIDVFSMGHPNITFIIEQTEKNVRTNYQGEIVSINQLNKIDSILNSLPICREKIERIGNIKGVCDFFCKNGRKYKMLYNGFFIEIDGVYYCDSEELIEELFGMKNNF